MTKPSSAKAVGRAGTKTASKPKSHSKAAPAKGAASKAGTPSVNPALLGAWVLDASLEHVPELNGQAEYKSGDRNLGLNVRFGAPQQQPNKHIIQTLQIRCIIENSATSKPIAVAEVTYMGIFDPAHFPTFKEESAPVFHMAQLLWPMVRSRVAALLAFAGHTPPLPEEMPRNQP